MPDDPNPYEDLDPSSFGEPSNEDSHRRFAGELDVLLRRAAQEYDLTVAQVVGELVINAVGIVTGSMFVDEDDMDDDTP